MVNLDASCSRYFTYRALIECGEAFCADKLQNLPLQQKSWSALSDLAKNILDPVTGEFGELTLTFGFCSPELAKARNHYAKSHGLLPDIYPALDQHASFELNSRGGRICKRGGAACDFTVSSVSSLRVALWIVRHLPFDRMYFYGTDKSLHVSYNSEGRTGEVIVMKLKASGRGCIPSTCKADKFLERFIDEL